MVSGNSSFQARRCKKSSCARKGSLVRAIRLACVPLTEAFAANPDLAKIDPA
jgi:hypothetical protein